MKGINDCLNRRTGSDSNRPTKISFLLALRSLGTSAYGSGDLPFLAGRIAPGGDGVTAGHLREEWIEGLRYQVVAVHPPGGLPSYPLDLDATSGLPLKRGSTQGSAKVDEVSLTPRRMTVKSLRGRPARTGMVSWLRRSCTPGSASAR